MPPIDAVGYRVVHPGPLLHQHQRITEEVLRDLQAAVAFAPLHDPEAITLIRDMMGRFPQARHYACFDTIFHQTMPAEASTYAIPIEYRRPRGAPIWLPWALLRRCGGRYASRRPQGADGVSPAHGDRSSGQRLQRDGVGGRTLGRQHHGAYADRRRSDGHAPRRS